MAFLFQSNYRKLAPTVREATSKEDEDEEARSFLHNDAIRQHATSNHKAIIFLTLVNAFILCVGAILFAVWFREKHLVRNADLRRASSYSPIHDLIDLDNRLVTINGTLFPPKHPSIGRQMPNAAADALWEEWELTRILPVTRADIVRMGKDPSTVAKLDDAVWGLGDDAYATILDTYHHLHCLNSLRHIAYSAHYGAHGAKADQPTMHEVHINHCVDLLVQAIQCSGNVNLITMHWIETQTHPYPDMSVNRKCIDFDKLTQWRRENTIDMDKYTKVMRRPEGQAELKLPDAVYTYQGVKNPNHEGGANPGEDFNL